MYIYKITNLINGKIYIGQTVKSIANSQDYYGSGSIIKKAIFKYGKENFQKDILESCTNREHLSEREMYWIYKLNSTNPLIGYNIALGGNGGDTISNNPNKKEISKRISDTLKGRKSSEETKKKISESNKGNDKLKYWKDKKLDLNHAKKIGDSQKGKKKHTEESKLKISQKNKGRIKTKKEREDISKRMKGCIPSNKLNIDIDQILKMKKTHTLKQISEILSIKVSTIKKRITNHIKRSK